MSKYLSLLSLIISTAVTLSIVPSYGQQFEVFHTFSGPDGGAPVGELLEAHDGNFYGTSYGVATNEGTLFKITPAGELTTLVYFAETNRARPIGGMVQGANGDFYGTTYSGGSNSLGRLFKLETNGAFTSLYSFTTNDAHPRGGLTLGFDGNYYGTTTGGSDEEDGGTIFRFNPAGTISTLHSFWASNLSQGMAPLPNLVQAKDGKLFGVTSSGGAFGYGTFFSITTNGSFISLYSFTATNRSPGGGLVFGDDGKLYGTTSGGGTFQYGTVFSITTSGVHSPVASFNYLNGSSPRARLTKANDGSFYGTCYEGGEGMGTVFRVTTNGAITKIISFVGPNGAYPQSGLLLAKDGVLYGGASSGGAYGKGVLFRITPTPILGFRHSGKNIVLSWPTNAPIFTLQSAADVGSTINWIDHTNAPSVVGANYTVTNPVTGTAQIYRLKK